MPIDRALKTQIDRILGNPDLYPDKFKTWVQKFISQSPLLTISGSQLAGFIPGGKIQFNYGTSAPFNPGNGDLWLYPADSTNGINWLFIWKQGSASTYKWEFIGGPRLFNQVVTEQSTASGTYAALGTAGPSIVLPRDGDYDVEIGARMREDTATNDCLMSYDIGGTGAVDADAIRLLNVPGGSQPHVQSSRLQRKTGLTAVTLTAKYKRNSAGNAFFSDRWMAVTPVRII